MIYVASSWRCQYQPEIVAALRAAGVEVYDFRNPPGRTGFSWSQIDLNWQNWNHESYRLALSHEIAEAGYLSDMDALRASRAAILAMPCGRSAHLEAGYVVGSGKPLAIFIPPGKVEPELMYKMAHFITSQMPELVKWAVAAEAGAYEADPEGL